MIGRDVYIAVRKLQLRTERALAGVWSGLAPSPFRGAGLAFEEVRPYIPGDDIRHFDWKVTARTGHPYVKKFIEDRERTYWLIIDRSPSMQFGSGDRTKFEAAVEIAAVFALHAAHRQDRAGLLTLDGKGHRFLPARRGVRHSLRLLAELLSDEPIARDVADGYERIRRSARRRSLVVVISDGFDQQLIEKIRDWGDHHEVLFVQTIDPWERQLPDAGLVRFRDAESGEWIVADTGDAKFREEYAELALQREWALRTRLARRRVRWVPIVTDRSPAAELLKRLSSPKAPRTGRR